MLEILNDLKIYLESNFNTYLTNVEVIEDKTISFIFVDIDRDSNPFKIIINYDGEKFTTQDIATTSSEIYVNIIFMVRKSVEAYDKVLECRNAFINMWKTDETLGGLCNYCQLIGTEIAEEIEMIESKDAKALKFSIMLNIDI